VLPRVIDELKSDGADLLFTFHPTLINVTQGRLPPEIGLWGVKTRRQGNQLPVDFLFHTFDYPEALDTASYRVEIDPASAATDSLLRAARQLRTTYGFRNLLLKRVGQQAFLSYNRHHGVPPQRVYEVGFGRLLRELRAIYGDGLLVTEGYNDLVSPLADGAYTWDQSRHPEVLAYSLPWARFSNDVEALDYAAANSAFAYGQALNLVVDGGLGSVADYPELARHLRSLGALRTAAASYYVDAEFRDRDGLRTIRVDPDVVVTVHANASLAKTAVVVANRGERRSQATFRLDPVLAAATGRILPANRPLDLKEPVAIDLAPYEVVLVAIDGAIVK
jgi:hypothetical protein